MNTGTHDFKFTDEMERELIRREIAAMGNRAYGPVQSVEPLLTWILSVAMAIGSVYIIVNSAL